MATEPGPVDASVLDVDKYDIPGLRTDIQDILDLPSAIMQVLKQSLIFVAGGTAVVWLIFRARMPVWALLPYVVLVFGALALAAAAISMFMVLRTRLEATDKAADRTLFTVAAMHGDLVRMQADGGSIPMQEVASVLTETVVFPMLAGTAGSMLETTAAASGPVGWVSSRLLKRALSAVEGRVLEALGEVVEPDLLDAPIAGELAPAGDPVDETWSHLSELELPHEISRWYEAGHRYLSRVVDGVEVLTVGGAGLSTAIATAPLVIVLILGWLLT